MTRRSIENPRKNQYRHMIPLMQVGLFFRRAQTFRNFLAAAAAVPENRFLMDGIRWATPLPASASTITHCYEHNAEFGYGDGAHRRRSRHGRRGCNADFTFYRGGENRQESRRAER